MAAHRPNRGIIALVTPDGTARCVATEIDFPNGMVVTPDNSTLIISESFAGRLTALTAIARTTRPTLSGLLSDVTAQLPLSGG